MFEQQYVVRSYVLSARDDLPIATEVSEGPSLINTRVCKSTTRCFYMHVSQPGLHPVERSVVPTFNVVYLVIQFVENVVEQMATLIQELENGFVQGEIEVHC